MGEMTFAGDTAIKKKVIHRNGDLLGKPEKYFKISDNPIPVYVKEFWTAQQRQAASIHEVSYRACFKPQLPNFFIQHLTRKDDVIYDPFGGRGTTAVEAALLGRRVISNDVNPLSRILTEPRLAIPDLTDIEGRLSSIVLRKGLRAKIDLSMFYHPETESEIVSLRQYLDKKRQAGTEDSIDKWIRMVATNRLTGHSPGFFSVYTLPPNQAVSPERQKLINEKKGNTPQYKSIAPLILKKSKQLISSLSNADISNLRKASMTACLLNGDARNTQAIPDESVNLTVTSPPFLDVIQYAQDNWLRGWFNCIDMAAVDKSITMARTVNGWAEVMSDIFQELFRITARKGWIAFEVGEVRHGKVRLDEAVVPLGINAGFTCMGILINTQTFTKTSNIWGIKNNSAGTNTNRIVLFQKP